MKSRQLLLNGLFQRIWYVELDARTYIYAKNTRGDFHSFLFEAVQNAEFPRDDFFQRTGKGDTFMALGGMTLIELLAAVNKILTCDDAQYSHQEVEDAKAMTKEAKLESLLIRPRQGELKIPAARAIWELSKDIPGFGIEDRKHSEEFEVVWRSFRNKLVHLYTTADGSFIASRSALHFPSYLEALKRIKEKPLPPFCKVGKDWMVNVEDLCIYWCVKLGNTVADAIRAAPIDRVERALNYIHGSYG